MVSSVVWLFLTKVTKSFSLSRLCKKSRLRSKSGISTAGTVIWENSLLPYRPPVSSYLRAGLANIKTQEEHINR
jgi:hypothetical protein